MLIKLLREKNVTLYNKFNAFSTMKNTFTAFINLGKC